MGGRKIIDHETEYVRILRQRDEIQAKLETIKAPLFRLKVLLEVPPSLDCVSQTNDVGEQRSCFIRSVFEESLENYCKAGFNIVEDVLKIIKGVSTKPPQEEKQ